MQLLDNQLHISMFSVFDLMGIQTQVLCGNTTLAVSYHVQPFPTYVVFIFNTLHLSLNPPTYCATAWSNFGSVHCFSTISQYDMSEYPSDSCHLPH